MINFFSLTREPTIKAIMLALHLFAVLALHLIQLAKIDSRQKSYCL